MLSIIKNLVLNEDGQALVEYGLVFLGVVSVVAVLVGFLGNEISNLVSPIFEMIK